MTVEILDGLGSCGADLLFEEIEQLRRRPLMGKPVEAEPDPLRRGHLVATPQVLGLETDRWWRYFARARVAKRRVGLHGPDDLRRNQLRAYAFERIRRVRGMTDYEGKRQRLADGSSIDRASFLAFSLVARRVQVDARLDIEAEFAGDNGKRVPKASHAPRASLLIGRRDEKQIP